MPDIWKRVRPGDDFNLSAEAWNGMLDAAKAEKARQLSQESTTAQLFRQGSIIKIHNSVGSDLPRCSVLALTQPLFLPSAGAQALEAFKREIVFEGGVPTSGSFGKFCVLIDPIKAAGIGRAYVDGVCPVMVNIVSASHTCCDVFAAHMDKLQSTATAGSAKILWSAGLTGDQWSIVRLGSNCRTC